MHALQHFQVDSKEVVSNLSTCVQTIHLTSSVGKKGDLERGATKGMLLRAHGADVSRRSWPGALDSAPCLRGWSRDHFDRLARPNVRTYKYTQRYGQWGSVSPRRRKIAQCSKATKPKSLTCP